MTHTERFRSRGTNAIYNTIAKTVGSIANQMKWDMHSPEVVYMGTSWLADTLEIKRNSYIRSIEAIETGETRFMDEEKKASTLRERKNEAGKKDAFLKKLESHLIHMLLNLFLLMKDI